MVADDDHNAGLDPLRRFLSLVRLVQGLALLTPPRPQRLDPSNPGSCGALEADAALFRIHLAQAGAVLGYHGVSQT